MKKSKKEIVCSIFQFIFSYVGYSFTFANSFLILIEASLENIKAS